MIYKVITTPYKTTIITHNRTQYGKHNANTKTTRARPRKTLFAKVNWSNVFRAINSINNTIECNIGQYILHEQHTPCTSLFITFTFAENLRELPEANKHYATFIRKLKNFLRKRNQETDIKYIAVPEFQQRGAVHYHVIYFNLPYIPNIYDVFNKLWGHGYVIFRKIKDFLPEKYLTKDMTKHFSLGTGTKRYFCSKGLIKPKIEVFTQPPKLKNKKLLSYRKKEYLNFTVETETYGVDN